MVLLDRCFVIAAAAQVLLLLIDDDHDVVEAGDLKREYEAMFVQPLDLPTVLCEMRSYVDVLFNEKSAGQMEKNDSRHLSVDARESTSLDADAMLSKLAGGQFWLRLCPLQRFARRVRYLLSRRGVDDGKLAWLRRQKSRV